MEPKFQTSFIPKKQAYPTIGLSGNGSMQKPKVHASSLFMFIAVIVFIISICGLGGAYFWKSYLTKAGENYKTTLATVEKQFDLDLIEDLKQVNVQIDYARKLLQNHIAMSKVFKVLENLTIEKVRFMSMDFKGPKDFGDNLSISMEGYGANLAAVAFQSDVLGKLSEIGLAKIVKNPIMSDPKLDANGSVSFGFSAEIDGKSMSYVQSVEEDLNTTNETSDSTTSPSSEVIP